MNNIKQELIINVINILKKETINMPNTLAELIVQHYSNDPYFILVSCLLSLRSKDTITYNVSLDLFSYAKDFNQLYNLPILKLESIIRKINFYKTKARTLHNIAKIILRDFNGKVPNNIDDLISIKGIGPKTASFVLSYAFGIPSICVDTHVHKIANRLAWVNTKDPWHTKIALESLLPKVYWNDINNLFVKLGQNICKSSIPLCSKCPISNFCPKIGVKNHK